MRGREPEILERFIVLEGIDGSGTTTQLQLLGEILEERGVPYHLTREPTDGPIGRQIRDVLAHRLDFLPRTVALLFAADRTEHLREITERLREGRVVITDRYLFSSLAYQSLGAEFPFVLHLNRRFPLPRHLFFLDTPLDVCQERIRRRADRELFDDRTLQQRVARNYERAMRRFSGSGMEVHRVDGTRPPGEISREIAAVILAES